MLFRKILLLSAIAPFFLGCSEDRSKLAHSSGDRSAEPPDLIGVRYCALRTSDQEVEAYFSDLAKALKSTNEVPGHFYSDSVIIVRDGTLVRLEGDAIAGAVAAEDWQIMNDLGASSLADAGWRGCILAHGKAVFEADDRGKIGLSKFDSDRPW